MGHSDTVYAMLRVLNDIVQGLTEGGTMDEQGSFRRGRDVFIRYLQ